MTAGKAHVKSDHEDFATEIPDANGQKGGGRWAAHKARRRLAILQGAVEAIESSAHGQEVTLQAISTYSQVARAAVYRYFADRAELDSRVREFVIDEIIRQVTDALTVHVSLNDAIVAMVGSYVAWAQEHPTLHEWVEQGLNSRDPVFNLLMGRLKAVLTERIPLLSRVGGALLDESDPGIEWAAFGVFAGVEAMITHWLKSDSDSPTSADLVQHATTTIWYVVDGLAQARDIVLDPAQSLSEILGKGAHQS